MKRVAMVAAMADTQWIPFTKDGLATDVARCLTWVLEITAVFCILTQYPPLKEKNHPPEGKWTPSTLGGAVIYRD